jgi:phosphatidylserine synthase
MQFLLNIWFQSIGIPVILILTAQGFFMLGKHGTKYTANDFSGLPYSLGTTSIAINAVLALNDHTETTDVERFYIAIVLLIFAMLAISIIQRLVVRKYLRIVNIVATIFSVFLMAATFALWRSS